MLPTTTRTSTNSLATSMIGYWLLMGLAYHVIYFGFPHPFRLFTWLHVIFWPIYIVLGLLRWVFYPFAIVALLGFVAVFMMNRGLPRR